MKHRFFFLTSDFRLKFCAVIWLNNNIFIVLYKNIFIKRSWYCKAHFSFMAEPNLPTHLLVFPVYSPPDTVTSLQVVLSRANRWVGGGLASRLEDSSSSPSNIVSSDPAPSVDSSESPTDNSGVTGLDTISSPESILR